MSIENVVLKCLNPIAPVVYGNELSYLEALGKVANKVNELVKVVNDVNVDTIRQDLIQLRNYVNTTVNNLKSEVSTELEKQTNYVISLIDTAINTVNEIVDSTVIDVNKKVEEALQTILNYLDLLAINSTAKSELSGSQVLVDRAIDIVYDRSRYYSLNCAEYENLSLNCSEYEGYNLLAGEYDLYGNVKLTPIYNGEQTVGSTGGVTYITRSLEVDYLVYKTKIKIDGNTGNLVTSQLQPLYYNFGVIRTTFGLPDNVEPMIIGYVENDTNYAPVYGVVSNQNKRITLYTHTRDGETFFNKHITLHIVINHIFIERS